VFSPARGFPHSGKQPDRFKPGLVFRASGTGTRELGKNSFPPGPNRLIFVIVKAAGDEEKKGELRRFYSLYRYHQICKPFIVLINRPGRQIRFLFLFCSRAGDKSPAVVALAVKVFPGETVLVKQGSTGFLESGLSGNVVIVTK